ncbi:hypothetical protein [Carboxylicivirga marina]|uniref:hypothetical protein n=1 Tax=Carboxylicivirga marina TaxID=2800988 RepID=UPI0025944979|nr:hypothetical protein [uncultured Carboxylicivirga sp.]
MEQELKNQKISISETLNSSFNLWKDNFITIAFVIAIVFIPVQILIELTSIGLENLRGPNYLESTEDWRRLADDTKIYDFIRQLIGVIATLGIFNFIYSLHRNNEDDRNSLELAKYGLRKWPENFVQTLIAGLITILYTLLLIIPGIYKAVQYCFVSNLVSDEENEPLEKSKFLVKGKWFDIFGMLLLIFLIGLIIELIVAVPFMFLPESFLISIFFGVLAAIASSYTIVIKGVYFLKIKELKTNDEEILITKND